MNSPEYSSVLITGASRGIGFSTAQLLSQKGFHVIGVSRKKPVNMDPFSSYFEIDITDRDSVRAMFDQLKLIRASLSVLVNNAGLAGENCLDESDDDQFWHQIMNVNLNATYYCSKYALPLLRNGGAIINVSSVLGLKGVPDQTAYCAAKHGVIGFTRSLAHYLAPRKIRVNAVCPGWTRTEMASQRIVELGWSDDQLKRSIPLGQMVEPEQIAEAIYYLVSPSSSMITGQTLTVDGGSLA